MKSILNILFLLSLISPCHAEWSQDDSPEMPAVEAENRIIKWCKVDGDHTRYASANIKLKGYEPCGKLKVISSCDASGNRLLSKNNSRPKGHLDCSKGPRIMIVSNQSEIVSDTSNVSSDIKPIDYKENKELKNEMKKAVERQNKDPEMQLQKAVDSMLSGLLNVDPKNGKSKSLPAKIDMKTMMDQFQQAMQSLDPQTKKQLKKFLDLK